LRGGGETVRGSVLLLLLSLPLFPFRRALALSNARAAVLSDVVVA
jgi:hypothetical protein